MAALLIFKLPLRLGLGLMIVRSKLQVTSYKLQDDNLLWLCSFQVGLFSLLCINILITLP
jgi:hypothetical protein